MVGSLVGAVLLCCWVGSIIECVQHVYKYWCSCCHHSDSNDFHVTTVLGNPTADPSTVIVAGRLPPSYSSIFQAETADTFRNDSAFHQDVTPSTSLDPEFRTYQNGLGPRSIDLYQCSNRSGMRDSFCSSPAQRSGTMDSIHCSLASRSRSGTMEAIHCSPTHRPRIMETSHCEPASRSGTMDSIHCSPAHRSGTMDSIHSVAHRSGTMDAIHFSPTHRSWLIDNNHCIPTNISGAMDAIHCSPTHRPIVDTIHCSPTHRPAVIDCPLANRSGMDIIHYSPTYRRKIKDTFHSPTSRILETRDSPHCSPAHRYGPVDMLNYTPITMTENMITFHCPQSNISNMPDITEHLNESSRSEQCTSETETGDTNRNDSSTEPRTTVVHACKTANAAVQVDLIPQSFYEGRSSIRWC